MGLNRCVIYQISVSNADCIVKQPELLKSNKFISLRGVSVIFAHYICQWEFSIAF